MSPRQGWPLNTVIHHETAEVADRLALLDLSADLLRDAVAMGEAARNSCTENDAISTPGFLAWSRTLRGLRELLAPMGWSKEVDRGFETTVAPNGKFAVAVATGDEATGRISGSPKTRHPKGSSTAAAIAQNQLSLFDESEPIAPRVATVVERVTWFLLIARGVDEVRCELSLPKAIGDDGRVESWAERIVLASVSCDCDPVVMQADQGQDIVIEVSRRTV